MTGSCDGKRESKESKETLLKNQKCLKLSSCFLNQNEALFQKLKGQNHVGMFGMLTRSVFLKRSAVRCFMRVHEVN